MSHDDYSNFKLRVYDCCVQKGLNLLLFCGYCGCFFDPITLFGYVSFFCILKNYIFNYTREFFSFIIRSYYENRLQDN